MILSIWYESKNIFLLGCFKLLKKWKFRLSTRVFLKDVKKVVFFQIRDKKKLFSKTFWCFFDFFLTLRTCFLNLKQKLTRLRVLKVLRLWLEDVLISLLISRFQVLFLKKVFFFETKVVSKLNLVSFCETKVVSLIFQSFWWYFFFVESFKGSKWLFFGQNSPYVGFHIE